MTKLRPVEKGENLVGYASGLAYLLFQGITRETGLPYTQEHLAEVALLVGRVTVPSDYQEAAIAAAWMHDSAEDTPVDVFDPRFTASRRKGVTYLNDLVEEAGNIGKAMCFMVHLMTHREGILYQDYVREIFSFTDSPDYRDPHILAGVLKMADRRKNSNPNEIRNVNSLVKDYLALEEAFERDLETFYKKTKTIDAFRKKGSMEIDVGLFVETLMDGFRAKQRTVAIDNLSQYLPLAEKKLLIEVGEGNGLFNYRAVRAMLKETYIDSLKLYPGGIHEIKRLGINNSASPLEGYTLILREIRNELNLKGKI